MVGMREKFSKSRSSEGCKMLFCDCFFGMLFPCALSPMWHPTLKTLPDFDCAMTQFYLNFVKFQKLWGGGVLRPSHPDAKSIFTCTTDYNHQNDKGYNKYLPITFKSRKNSYVDCFLKR